MVGDMHGMGLVTIECACVGGFKWLGRRISAFGACPVAWGVRRRISTTGDMDYMVGAYTAGKLGLV